MVCRIFRAFREKSFDCVEKKYSRVILADVCTWYTVSLCGHFYKNARPRFAFSGCLGVAKFCAVREEMYALVEMGMQLFRRKITKTFSDIDALAVSMSEKLLHACRRHAFSFFSKSAFSFFKEKVSFLLVT